MPTGKRGCSEPSSSTYRLADALLGGRLAKRLVTLRKAGASYETIARTLHSVDGITVSSKTVSSWVKQLGIDDGEAA